MQLKASLFSLVLGVSIAGAAPQPKLVTIELETQLIFSDKLGASDAEPGGLLVPADADKELLELGLMPGDIVRYQNGSPLTDRLFVSDGLTVLDVVRNGKPLVIHILIHSEPTEHVDMTADQFKELVETTSKGPISTPMLRGGKPSGVRSTEILVGLYTRIQPGDIVRTINGTAIHTDSELVAALQSLKVGVTQILVERADRQVLITIDRTAPLDFTLIHTTGKNHYEVPLSLAIALRDELDLFGQKARTVQIAKNGVVHGRKVFAIESGALVAALGLQNDDIVLDIDGRSFDAREDIYSLAYDLDKNKDITLHIERKGKPVALIYTITN